MRERKVFIVAQRHWEVSKVESYGKLVPLCGIAMPKFNTDEMRRTFTKVLTQESHKEDFILLSGLSVMNAIACSVFALLHGRINLLIHSRATGNYLTRIVNFSERV